MLGCSLTQGLHVLGFQANFPRLPQRWSQPCVIILNLPFCQAPCLTLDTIPLLITSPWPVSAGVGSHLS